MFDAIAFRYDQLNHLLSLGIDRSWRRKVVRRVKSLGAHRILDVATGTGDLALMMARACPAATIEGIDLSEQMLAIGQQKVGTYFQSICQFYESSKRRTFFSALQSSGFSTVCSNLTTVLPFSSTGFRGITPSATDLPAASFRHTVTLPLTSDARLAST